MDPSIMKLLEEDEDESMHSGADVEAFQAALNRDIGGDASTSLASDSVLSNEPNQTSSLPYPNWQPSKQDENANSPGQQPQQEDQNSFAMDLKRHGSALESQQLQNDVKQEPGLPLHQKQTQDNLRQGEAAQVPLQTPRTTGMQISERHSMERPGNLKNQIPFMLLLPALKPHLDKDREMQLQTLFSKLRKNEIAKEQFVRLMRNIVGDQVIRLAVAQLQPQPGSNQSQLQSQAFVHQQNLRMPTSSCASSAVQVQADTSYQPVESNTQKSREVERQLDSHGMQVGQLPSSGPGLVNQDREHSSTSMQGHSKQQQQQHLHFPQTSFPMYGGSSGTFHPYSGTNVNTSGSSTKPQPHDLQMMQISHQGMGVAQMGGSTQSMNLMGVPKFERQSAITDPGTVQSGPISQFANKPVLQQNSAPWQPPSNKEQSSAPFSSMNYVKHESVEQSSEQLQKSQLSTSHSLSVASIEKGNALPGNLKDESLEKQSSKVGFPTPMSGVPLNSIPPSIPTQLDPNVQGNAVSGNLKEDSVEKQSSKVGFPSSMAGMQLNSISPSVATQLDPNVQVGPRIPSAALSAGGNARTPPKKPSVGQKKPLEALGSSPPASSKKQKVSGAFSDQSIDQLNDVTAVSGVNLREEEEQLFSGSKEESRVSEASRRVVQEEEERLILQKVPLQKRLAEIMFKCGLKNINNDVERCLSLCVEERLRGLISNLIRLSKQRVDAEKPRHRTVITSDVRQQLVTMNRKAKEEWEKKQAEAEKLRKVNEPEGDNGIEGDKEKDENRLKAVKVNKEEDDKMRTTAANIAARNAVGGDDMLSKWQLMAEQTRRHKDVSQKSTSGRKMKDNQDTDKRSPTTASRAVRKFGRNQASVPHIRVARSISVKDVITALEREPQMSKSTLIYRLYERIRSDTPAE
ncbi:transcription initiation factor TFIID subunit 4-like isoform X2 [Euphorbia lathyris]|uniref:transcription initiation factor TFIID subunit 4-like isoform X2 n=1 Tax=Euphorbia lathyris TaxID=212925 RepID=UPI003313B3C3